jgi:hypothetical protein
MSSSTVDLTEGCSEKQPESILGSSSTMQTSSPLLERSSSFRLSAKDLFLTYPKCPVSPESSLSRLETVFRGMRSPIKVLHGVAVREFHEDGDPHLHIFLALEKRCNIVSPNLLDLSMDPGEIFHGNYQTCRDKKRVVDYVRKSDPSGVNLSYIGGADALMGYLLPKGKKQVVADVMDLMKSGRTLTQIGMENRELLGTCVLHGDKVEAFYNKWMLENAKPELVVSCFLPPPRPQDPQDPTHFSNVKLAAWLQCNLFDLKGIRPLRTKQLWLHGVHHCGKTSMLCELQKMFRCYTVPMLENFHDFYDDNRFDLIIFDEYRGQKTITEMNSFVDGSTLTLRKKGGQVIKKKNLPVIVCSNYSIGDCYHDARDKNSEGLLGLMDRFETIYYPQGFVKLYPVIENHNTENVAGNIDLNIPEKENVNPVVAGAKRAKVVESEPVLAAKTLSELGSSQPSNWFHDF